mgnify:CR=1 FL=1
MIIPSEDTQDTEYRAALEFVSKNRTLDQLRAGAADLGLSTEVAGPFKANDYIFGTLGTGQTSRDIIQFAFNGNSDINDVSSEIYTYADPVTNVSNKHVIAALVSVAPAGLPSVADIKSDIEKDNKEAIKNETPSSGSRRFSSGIFGRKSPSPSPSPFSQRSSESPATKLDGGVPGKTQGGVQLGGAE